MQKKKKFLFAVSGIALASVLAVSLVPVIANANGNDASQKAITSAPAQSETDIDTYRAECLQALAYDYADAKEAIENSMIPDASIQALIEALDASEATAKEALHAAASIDEIDAACTAAKAEISLQLQKKDLSAERMEKYENDNAALNASIDTTDEANQGPAQELRDKFIDDMIGIRDAATITDAESFQ